ncbi:unnamed protein product [Toxocara canis]|uniref:Uncharacterized protein n=1 Tax=Toxocara canis TaxID=6265 RepID=A0A183V0M5_TOXCA|nr:unnamed protein product [Toxocara canis]
MRSRVMRNLSLLEKGIEKITTTHDAWRKFLTSLTEEECEASNNFLEVAEKGDEAVVAHKCRFAE